MWTVLLLGGISYTGSLGGSDCVHVEKQLTKCRLLYCTWDFSEKMKKICKTELDTVHSPKKNNRMLHACERVEIACRDCVFRNRN